MKCVFAFLYDESLKASIMAITGIKSILEKDAKGNSINEIIIDLEAPPMVGDEIYFCIDFMDKTWLVRGNIIPNRKLVWGCSPAINKSIMGAAKYCYHVKLSSFDYLDNKVK